MNQTCRSLLEKQGRANKWCTPMDPSYGRAKAGRPARTYIQQLCEDTGCDPEDLPEAMNNKEKWRERVRDDDDQMEHAQTKIRPSFLRIVSLCLVGLFVSIAATPVVLVLFWDKNNVNIIHVHVFLYIFHDKHNPRTILMGSDKHGGNVQFFLTILCNKSRVASILYYSLLGSCHKINYQ